MADPYKDASTNVQNRTQRILEAVAQGGTAGLKAFEDSETATAEDQKQAVARAQHVGGLIGGPEAQGFEAIPQQDYARTLTNLGAAKTGFESDMAARGGAFHDYMGQVGAAIPLHRSATDRLIAQEQAKADAAAKDKADENWYTKLIGATDVTDPEAQEQLAAAEQALEGFEQNYGAWESGSNVQPHIQKMEATGARLDEVNEEIERASRQAPKTGKASPRIQRAWAERDRLVEEQRQTQKKIDSIRAYNALQMKNAPGRQAELQAAYDQAQAYADPVQRGRDLGTKMFPNVDPLEIAGRLRAGTPAIGDITGARAPEVDEYTSEIADKVNLRGGAPEVAEILERPDVQQFVTDATQLSAGGDYKWEEILEDLKTDYLAKGDESTYKTLRHILKQFDWKKDD